MIMVVVDVIKVGYSYVNPSSNKMKANCTCSLIVGDHKVVLVDTLTAWDKSYLIQALNDRNFSIDEITHVVCTHGHSDHIGNLNLFTKALHIVGQSISRNDEYTLYDFKENYNISDNISVMATPGHTLSDVSVIVKQTSLGVIAIVGDLFEREEDISNSALWKEIAGSENPELQIKNREKILNLADYIIPGHGPMFKVESYMKQHIK